MVSFGTSDLKKIGKVLTWFVVIFTLVGVMLFFDTGLLAIGNGLLLLGVIMTVGPSYALQIFFKPRNYKGSLSLIAGFILVITGRPILGILVQTSGFFFIWCTMGVRELDEFLYESRPKYWRI